MKAKIYLAVIAGSEHKIFELEDGQSLLVGRSEQSDTQINDRSLSRTHFRLSLQGSNIQLADVGSSSGTFVNGGRVETAVELKFGDKVKAGNTTFQILGKPPTQEKSAGQGSDNVSIAELTGHKFGNFVLTEVVATGRSSIVFRGEDSANDRVAAVKVMRPQYAGDEQKRERFVRAMKTMQAIDDPHIIQLYAAGRTGRFCWMAMEFVEGQSLFDLIKSLGPGKGLDWPEVWRAAVHVTRALQFAYYQSIIHRNVTPHNILRRNADQLCKLGDFMLAKAIEGTLAFDVTSPGQIVGDLKYLPPERLETNGMIDTRSDIYGLGATCYAMLTGRMPVSGKSVVEIVNSIKTDVPKNPLEYNAEINPKFAAMVMRMLAKQPEERYNTPNVLLKELEDIGRASRLETDFTGWWGS